MKKIGNGASVFFGLLVATNVFGCGEKPVRIDQKDVTILHHDFRASPQPSAELRRAFPEGITTGPETAPPPEIAHEYIVNEFHGYYTQDSPANGVVVWAGEYRLHPEQPSRIQAGRGFLYVMYGDPARVKPITFVAPRGSGALRIVRWNRAAATFNLQAVAPNGDHFAARIPPPTVGSVQQFRALMPIRYTLADQPVPVPSATNCRLFQQMYPPTQKAFDEQHLTTAQRAEILKWTKEIPRSDLPYSKWMRAEWTESALLIFDAHPLHYDYEVDSVRGFDSNGKPVRLHAIWQALNSNIILDPSTCEIYAYPTA